MQGPSGEPALAMKHLSASSLRKGIGKKKKKTRIQFSCCQKLINLKNFFIYCGYISFYEHHFWCICMYSENNSFKGSWICCQWHYLYNMLLDTTIQCSRNFVVKLNKEIHENKYSTNNYKTRVVSVFLYTLIVTLDSMQFNICVGSWKIVLYTLTM